MGADAKLNLDKNVIEINRPSLSVCHRKDTGTCASHTGDWSCSHPCGCGSAGKIDTGTAGAATGFAVESATAYSDSTTAAAT
ncbi:hypothetical protein M378DRAFT_172209 [Amanita muscaria Koide BX008]|uniref:Uncharacterized protein n=1 Tax=Amanita muscaria (strain Koide BX008) TaxID=946122 RepID=A0A0C2S317_AMAMK|nr:hypothetical protein M378DRAFT_172209 [Amanita muscaria Koide BX008]